MEVVPQAAATDSKSPVRININAGVLSVTEKTTKAAEMRKKLTTAHCKYQNNFKPSRIAVNASKQSPRTLAPLTSSKQSTIQTRINMRRGSPQNATSTPNISNINLKRHGSPQNLTTLNLRNAAATAASKSQPHITNKVKKEIPPPRTHNFNRDSKKARESEVPSEKKEIVIESASSVKQSKEEYENTNTLPQ